MENKTMDDDERAYTNDDILDDIAAIKLLIKRLNECLTDLQTTNPRHTTPILKAEEYLQISLNRLIDDVNGDFE